MSYVGPRTSSEESVYWIIDELRETDLIKGIEHSAPSVVELIVGYLLRILLLMVVEVVGCCFKLFAELYRVQHHGCVYINKKGNMQKSRRS